MVRPPYWVGQRLMVLAVGRWPEFQGSCLMRGVDPLDQPLPSLLSMVYAWAVEGTSAKEREKWRDELWLPPESVDIDDAPGWSDEELMEGFGAALAAARSGRQSGPGQDRA